MSFNSSSISFPSTQLVDDMMDFFDSPLKKYLKLKKKNGIPDNKSKLISLEAPANHYVFV